jgi:hypothetical protein
VFFHAVSPAFSGPKRNRARLCSEKAGDREVQRTMLELLNQLDGFQSDTRIKVWMGPRGFQLDVPNTKSIVNVRGALGTNANSVVIVRGTLGKSYFFNVQISTISSRKLQHFQVVSSKFKLEQFQIYKSTS